MAYAYDLKGNDGGRCFSSRAALASCISVTVTLGSTGRGGAGAREMTARVGAGEADSKKVRYLLEKKLTESSC